MSATRYEMMWPDGTMRVMPDTRGMVFPVRCRCGGVYDMGGVTVTARYLDCSVWITPCCRRQEDDRPWSRGYTELRADPAASREAPEATTPEEKR